MKRRNIFYSLMSVLAATVAFTYTSCSTDTVFYSYAHTPLSGWEKNDTLTFRVPRLSADGIYAQQLGLRMTNAFPFTSISLIVEQMVLPKGNVLTDTVRCTITDVRGNFLGDGVSSYQYLFPVREEHLHKGDSLCVRIRHNMKREILPGVSDVGLKMETRQ